VSETVRAFLAVPPDAAWAQSGRELLARVRPDLPEAAWTRPDTWHLTLRFLGNVPRDSLARFTAEIGAAARDLGAVSLLPAGTALFPRHGRPRVLGIGLRDETDALRRLAQQADRAALGIGVAGESRDLHPHVTFARLRRPWPAEAIGRFRNAVELWNFPVWSVRRLVLYESRLEPAGPVHRPVGQWNVPASAETSP